MGKSTIAKKLVEAMGENWIHIELENFMLPYFRRMAPGVKNLAYLNSKAVAQNFIKAGYSLIIEGRLFLEVKYLHGFRDFLKDLNLEPESFELTSPMEILLERNRKRDHRKPEERMIALFNSFEPLPDGEVCRIFNESLEDTVGLILKKTGFNKPGPGQTPRNEAPAGFSR